MVALFPVFSQPSFCILHRGGVASPAGPAKAGPLFSGLLVLFSDCRDSLSHSEDETIGPGVPHKLTLALRVCVSHIIVPALLSADQEPLRALTRLHRHPRILIPQVAFLPHIVCCRPPLPSTYTSDLLFAVAWPLLKCRRCLCCKWSKTGRWEGLGTWLV